MNTYSCTKLKGKDQQCMCTNKMEVREVEVMVAVQVVREARMVSGLIQWYVLQFHVIAIE